MFLLHAPLERWVFLLILSVYPYDLLSQVVNLRLGTTNQNLFYQYVKEQTPLCGWESNPQPWLYKNPALTVELPHSDCLTVQIYNFYPNQQVFNQFFLRSRSDSNWRIRVLQTPPLSHLGTRPFGWPMGIEPTTFWTTIRRSNLLSYGQHVCTLKDSNLRPSRCKRDALNQLS